MKLRFCLLVLTAVCCWSVSAGAADKKFEAVLKDSVKVHSLKSILRPFVATCEREKNYFRRLFCEALNERLKAQHQTKLYFSNAEVSAAGPLVVKFKAKPKPTAEITIRGCLTCKEPMLARAGGDVSKGRFFMFKMPKDMGSQLRRRM